MTDDVGTSVGAASIGVGPAGARRPWATPKVITSDIGNRTGTHVTQNPSERLVLLTPEGPS